MRHNHLITPDGSSDRLNPDSEALYAAEKAVCKLFAQEGYREVRTPELEFYDVFSLDSEPIPQQQMYKLTDNKGRLLVLRPDNTMPIARLAATKLRAESLPLRLYYNQPCFRISDSYRGGSDQIRQAGVELIGAGGFDADIEVLTLALRALDASGADYRLEIGSAGIFKALVALLPVGEQRREELRRCIEAKSYAALAAELESVGDSDAVAAIRMLPRLFGGRDVLDRARGLIDNESINAQLDYLGSIYDRLSGLGFGDRLIIDLGLVRQMDYYTGIVFSAYARGSGERILGGGRYDSLLGQFGFDNPACGFGINIDALVKSLGAVRSDSGTRPLRIALTKGRLEQKTVEMFEGMGIDCAQLHDKGRRLIFTVGDGIELVLAKAADVITYVENGVCDLGVVGKDTILEMGAGIHELLDLGFGRCRFAVATKVETDIFDGAGVKTIATKYPNITRRYFESNGMDVNVIKIEGSVELAPLLELSDAIVDIVETGSTLKENGLEVKREVCPISARLVCNTASLKLRREEIEALTTRIEAKLGGNA